MKLNDCPVLVENDTRNEQNMKERLKYIEHLTYEVETMLDAFYSVILHNPSYIKSLARNDYNDFAQTFDVLIRKMEIISDNLIDYNFAIREEAGQAKKSEVEK